MSLTYIGDLAAQALRRRCLRHLRCGRGPQWVALGTVVVGALLRRRAFAGNEP